MIVHGAAARRGLLRCLRRLLSTAAPNKDLLLSSYDYDLPPSLIATSPAAPRDTSRLMHVANDGRIAHLDKFSSIVDLIEPDSLLVFNDTKVIPARLPGRRVQSNGRAQVFLLESKSTTDRSCVWHCLVQPGRKMHVGTRIDFDTDTPGLFQALIVGDVPSSNGRLVEFNRPLNEEFYAAIDKYGQVPLPPYIEKSIKTGVAAPHRDQYQTVYARERGAVAAPTAGLHFTDTLLQRLVQEKNVQLGFCTLHVGLGTFRPVEVDDVTTHHMHEEWVHVPAATMDMVHAARAAGRKVVAVGTTTVRALESAFASRQPREQGAEKDAGFLGMTAIFIYPGYEFKVIDALITNFHLPRSTLMMMVSALIPQGREKLLHCYQVARDRGYRFYSFGDAMYIQRK